MLISVSQSPQMSKNIQFIVIEEERKQKIFTFIREFGLFFL